MLTMPRMIGKTVPTALLSCILWSASPVSVPDWVRVPWPSILGLLGSVALALFAIFWYLFKLIFKRRQPTRPERKDREHEARSSAASNG